MMKVFYGCGELVVDSFSMSQFTVVEALQFLTTPKFRIGSHRPC